SRPEAAADRWRAEPENYGHRSSHGSASQSNTGGGGPNAADLSEESILRARTARPTMGWRGAVFAASGGRVNPGVSEQETARNVLLRRIRRNLPGAHQIAVSSLKGGV